MALSVSCHPILEQIHTIDGTADAWRLPASRPNNSMRSRMASVCRTEFQVDDSAQRVVLMERMIADFDCMAADLDQEILIQQDRAGINDPAHFAYPTFAKAAILRRDNMRRSADVLRAHLAKATEASSTE